MFVGSFGNLNLDVYVRIATLPREMGTAMRVKDGYISGGGAASNFAVAVARLGVLSRLFACVGADEIGNSLLNELSKEGVDIRFVKRVNLQTGFVVIFVHEATGERTMLAFRGANDLLSSEVFTDENVKDLYILHFASVNPDIVTNAGQKVRKINQNIILTYDPGSITVKMPQKIKQCLNFINILFLNEYEWNVLSASLGVRNASELLNKYNTLKCIVVKAGAKGAFAHIRGAKFTKDAFSVRVIDTTGAGDAFNAGFIVARLAGLDIDEALTVGNAVAALKISKRGARSAPYLDQVVAFLRKNKLGRVADKLEQGIKALRARCT